MNDAALPQLPPRANQSHKGDYGRVLLVGGSRGMSGAVCPGRDGGPQKAALGW